MSSRVVSCLACLSSLYSSVPVEASEGQSMQDYQVVPNFRIRTIPVFGALPAIFGMACAAHVVTTLAGQPFDSEPVFRMQRKQYETQLDRLRDRENERGVKGCMGVDLEAGIRLSPIISIPLTLIIALDSKDLYRNRTMSDKFASYTRRWLLPLEDGINELESMEERAARDETGGPVSRTWCTS